MAARLLAPIPSGEILFEDFMKPLGLSINALARDIDVPPNRISGVVSGKREVTAGTALRLEKICVSPEIEKWQRVARAAGIRPNRRSNIAELTASAQPPGLRDVSSCSIGGADKIDGG